jgi:hypothetical protein
MLSVAFCAACGELNKDSGELKLMIYGEPFIEEGIPAEEMSDGWAVSFERFELRVGALSFGGEQVEGLSSVDLARPTMGEGQELVTLTLPEGSYTGASFTLTDISVKGSATKGEVTKRFEWALEGSAHYMSCEHQTSVSAAAPSRFEVTVHADHLFYDSLVSEEPALAFQALADADLNGDDLISAEELAQADIGAYDPGSSGEVNDLWAWLNAHALTLGHVDGEGHCDSHGSAP